jgi:hypothetical protein
MLWSLEVEVDKAIIGVFWERFSIVFIHERYQFSKPRGDGGVLFLA